MLRDMFKKTYTLIDTKYKNHSKNEPNIPEGLWRKCKKCGQPVYGEDVKNNNYICPKCKAYFRVHAYRRIDLVADPGTFEEWNALTLSASQTAQLSTWGRNRSSILNASSAECTVRLSSIA